MLKESTINKLLAVATIAAILISCQTIGSMERIGGKVKKEKKPYPIKIHKYHIFKKRGFRTYKRVKPIKYFVIHGTAGGSTIRWIERMPRWKKRYWWYRKGVSSFHYLILRDGTIYELIPPERFVYHSHGGRIYDHESIGIELENLNRKNWGGYTMKQYKALSNLYNYFRVEYGLVNMKTITTHNRIKRNMRLGWKNCPGRGFNWKVFLKSFLAGKYSYSYKKKRYDYIYNIKKLVSIEKSEKSVDYEL